MGFNDEYLKLRKKRLEEQEKEQKNTPFVFTSGPYQNATLTEGDIAPVANTKTVKATEAEKKNEGSGLFKAGAFSDGYQFGDVTKTILGTAGDAATGIVQGIFGIGEGIADLIGYGVAGVYDLSGNPYSAEMFREIVAENQTEQLFDPFRKKTNIADTSLLGDFGYGIAQGVGQVGAVIATGGAGSAAGLGTAGTTALTTGMVGASSMGSGMSEAYQSGATDEEALAYGAMSGVIDAGTELIFGGLGKSVKAIGVSKGVSSLDDVFAKKLSEKMSNQFFKNATEFGVKATGEGLEEVLAGLGSAAAKKLTYMSDEELAQLVEDENLLEQFAAGAIVSGIAQSGDLVRTTKQGRDFITNFSANEETVIEKVYNDRLTEAEQDGTKLTNNEKNKLYEQVQEEMRKGYISADDIESILGGETYKSYKETVDSEDAILKEFDELGKKQNATLADQARYAELQEKVKEIKSNKARDNLKSQLSQTVYDSVKGKDFYLAESYHERARRGTAFEADLSQYDGKTAETVKRAIDSGILNNTRRTHEFVDMVAKISADKGVLFDFTNNAKLKESGFAIDGKFVNGYVTKDGISVNIDSHKSLNSIVGHEISHVLEGTELYTEMQSALFEYAKSKKDYDGRRKTLEELYKNVKGAEIDAELTADLVGDYLFTDADFINNLSTKHRNVFKKIYDEIKYLLKVATAGSKEARELEKVKRAFDKAYRANSKASGDTKYSLSDSDGTKLTKEQSEYFKDSKVRDKNGNLKVMHHGSPETFTVFDKKKARSSGTYGKGFYFTDSTSHAATYGKAYDVYLNITNPLQNGTNDITKEQIRKFVEAIAEDEDYGIDNYGYDATIDSVTDSVYGKSDFGMIMDLNISCVGNMVEAIELFNKVNGTNYDGIVAPTETVAFYPEQIKNVDNKAPTSNPDIRFSLSKSVEETKDLIAVHNLSEEKLAKSLELGGLPMPSIAIARAKDGHSNFGNISLVFNKETIDPQFMRSNKVYSGDAYTPTYPRVEYKLNDKALKQVRDKISNLVSYDVLTNVGNAHLDSDNMTDALNRFGGNVAEAFKNDDGLKYAYLKDTGANITLPMKEKNLSYYGYRENGAIIRVAEALSAEELQQALNGGAKAAEEIEPIVRSAVAEYMQEKYGNDTELLDVMMPKEKLTFSDLNGYIMEARNYHRNGVQQTVDTKAARELIREQVNQAEYENWLKNLFSNIVEKEGIRNEKDLFTPSGNRRSFEALHYEHNLENVIKAMKEKGDKGVGAFGGGNIFGAATTEYGSISEIKTEAQNRMKLMSESEYDEMRKGFSDRFFELAHSLPIHKDSFVATDDAANMLIEAVAKYKTKSGMATYLRNESKGWANYSDYVVEDLIQLVSEIRSMPVGYFEAKPQRAVGFNEVATAIIPDNTSADLKQILTDRGIPFVEYESGNEQARLEALNSLEEAKFSLSAEGETPKRYGNYNIFGEDISLEAPTAEDVAPDSEVVAENAIPTENVAPTDESLNNLELQHKIVKQKYMEASKANDAEAIRRYSEELVDLERQMAQAEATTPEKIVGDFAPIAEKKTSNVLYNKRDGNNGWGDVYGSAQEALNDAVEYVNSELWNAINKEIENSVDTQNSVSPMTNALIAVQEDVRQETITPMQGAQLLSEAYNQGGVDSLKGLYNPKTGNLYDRYLEKAKQYDTKAENIAPMPSEPTIYDLEQEQSELEDKIRVAMESNDPSAPALIDQYGELLDTIAKRKKEESAMESERLASLDDADAPPEVEAPYYGESTDTAPENPFEDRDIKAVGNRKVNAYMYENPEVKPFFQAEANVMLGELQNTIKGERWYNAELHYASGGEYGWGGAKRHTTPDIAYLLDVLRFSYADIEKGLNAIIEDNGKENNAASKRIEFLLNDRLINGYRDADLGFEIPPNQDYINLLNEKQISEYSEEARAKFFEEADKYDPLAKNIAPVAENKTANEPIIDKPIEDIAPIAESAPKAEAYEAIKPKKENNGPRMKRVKEGEQSPGEIESPKVAEILTEEPETPKKKNRAFAQARANLLDKGAVFEDLSLKTGNRELQGKYNFMHYSEARAQKYIADHLKPIVDKAERSGKSEQLYEYVYHLHNIDRMSLESQAKPTIDLLRGKFVNLKESQIRAIAAKKITENTTEKTATTIREAREYLKAIESKNKPVFGDTVTADVSREVVKKLEAENPELKELSEAVIEYNTQLRQMLVDSGVISQETADLWAKMYPHYVPIRRLGDDGLSVNVPLDTRKTGINAPIKRAKGGNRDIMPLFDTMAMRTEQTFKAIAKNNFGTELLHTLGSTIESSNTNVDEMIDSVENHEELLQKGKKGKNPTFTVFENGKKVTFEITEDMYDALKPTSKGLSYTNKAANTASNIFRGILTEYNPVFMASNAIKDVQDVLINSQHAAKTYANIPKAIKEMSTKGRWYAEYMENGGEQNTYFDSDSKTFKQENKGFIKTIGMPLRAISTANNFIERAPRLAEYIASREAGASVETAMLDAARVTTNFAAGGDVTKFLNRNGATFLNASVQGFNQNVRNVREAKANGLKGWVKLASKVALAGLPALLLNNLLWDDDEEYEELSEYVKDNYYVVAKTESGKFIRIPKGRMFAVIQDGFEQMGNAITGNDEVDFENFFELVISNLAPNNPLENNILAPIIQVANNKTWYGEDLVPTRLQDLPDAEQFDESTDAISKWLGEKLNISPYKLNYLFDQYSGGVGDVFLPMITPEAESGDNSFVGNITAPMKDKFSTDGVLNNKNVSDFYDTMDKLTTNAKSSKATDEDILKYKYMNSVSTELSELYAEKREIQNSDLPDDEKYEAVRELQMQINDLARESLSTYNNVYISDGYAAIGDTHYRWYEPGEDSDAEAGWQKITDKQLEKQEAVTSYLGVDPAEYWKNKTEYDFAYEYPEKYSVAKSVGGYSAYKKYTSELYDIKADKDEYGKSISGSRKEKVIEYVNNLDIDYGERLILFKSEYNADDTYNYEIIDYLNNRQDISYEEMVTILKELGFVVRSDGTILWD